MRQESRKRAGAEIDAALRERRAEIEQAILTRVHAVSEPPPRGGPEYAEGLRAAVAAGVEYGLEGIARGDQSARQFPRRFSPRPASPPARASASTPSCAATSPGTR
jgi:hypothetical protein